MWPVSCFVWLDKSYQLKMIDGSELKPEANRSYLYGMHDYGSALASMMISNDLESSQKPFRRFQQQSSFQPGLRQTPSSSSSSSSTKACKNDGQLRRQDIKASDVTGARRGSGTRLRISLQRRSGFQVGGHDAAHIPYEGLMHEALVLGPHTSS